MNATNDNFAPALTRWLSTLPPSGFKGTSSALRESLARCLDPNETLPGPKRTVRTIGVLLAATRYRLRHDRKTANRWIIVEPESTP